MVDLRRTGEQFDFIFLDPPYLEGAAQGAIDAIFALGLLTESGRVILEHADQFPPKITTPLARLKQTKRYSTCAVSIFKRATDEAEPE